MLYGSFSEIKKKNPTDLERYGTKPKSLGLSNNLEVLSKQTEISRNFNHKFVLSKIDELYNGVGFTFFKLS